MNRFSGDSSYFLASIALSELSVNVRPQSGGKVALKTHHNNYISAVSGGAGEPINQAPHLYSYEKFTPISKNDDTDTLDFSSTSTQSITINLSSYYVQTVNRNLKLRLGSALGIDIKNVVGGTKNDRLTGNKLNNNLSGGNGDDYIDGRAGSDSMYGASISSQKLIYNYP